LVDQGNGKKSFRRAQNRIAENSDKIYTEDAALNRSIGRNETVQQLYKEFLKEPLGEKSHHLLHTKYDGKPVV
jgi:hypothetical protein